ncbi:DUF742 domain-containing protein [Actinophytocola oryzae]|uniref:Uncharacterized protein DUF742 n=1 Tax=Actinophytocola oryzae TaxID=502181 RepID=A0A4R7W0Y1_9PSEU|nr:DUF742 domain-containing protein [Actinophytocola oryzae]TDV56183.1 uncharacterized protein DUF742 [Actinophytocola oryzae]
MSSGGWTAPDEEEPATVRAYTWTGGRTKSRRRLEIETLVSTSARAEEALESLRSEHQSVAVLCYQSRSVAEVGALMSLPLGVVRVLLDDMANLGLLDVHHNQVDSTAQPELPLLDRVLRGLRNLPA